MRSLTRFAYDQRIAVASFVVAVVGLTLAAASLGWQAATFRLSGPRVRVAIREGLRGRGAAVLLPPDGFTPASIDSLVRQGYTEPVLAIAVENKGRMAATINRWTLRFDNGAAYENPTDPINPPLPYRLESFTSQTWYARRDHLQRLREAFADDKVRGRVRAEVDLAGQGTISSKDAVVMSVTGKP